ncbi:SDR family oxidoreductase [Streptomyces sp. NPDC096311]|uniref:SDR family oxidoreductase n=1 Tax=Streptomyces sp. NPDC096311 TaxID=3366083 RepID=UPI0038095577
MQVVVIDGTGVNTLTGEGLAEVLEGAQVVVDVSNSPSFADDDAMEFFRTSTASLLKAEGEAGVTHHVALSVVGAEHLQDSGCLRAEQAQEELIKASGIPFSIVHTTRFFEFMKGIAAEATEDDTVRLAPATIRPIHSDDVAATVGRTALGTPVNGVVEMSGSDTFQLDEVIRKGLAAKNDPRTVVTGPHARYFGAELQKTTLLPGPDARIADTRFTQWLAQQQA